MNCNEFKNKVAELFDTTIDIQTQSECRAHMAECPECKAYYEELAKHLMPYNHKRQPNRLSADLLASCIISGAPSLPPQCSS